MTSPYERIAVITDPAIHDPAVAVASRLGAHVGALELICCSPDRTSARLDRTRLERLAARHGWAPAACTVLTGDAATMLRRHLGRRRRTLTVVGPMFEHLLAATGQPRLIIRPAVEPCDQAGPFTEIADIASLNPDDLEMIARWAATAGSAVVTSDAPG